MNENTQSNKYFKISEEYYQAGFTTRNLANRYKFWNISQTYKKVAECFEKLEKQGVENV